ncbi:MAG: Ig-like domain-containing protein [Caldilineaceae bacterium]
MFSDSLIPMAQGAAIYVDHTVSSSGNGSSSSPFKTVREGINAVADDGTVWIRRGVYGEPLTISKPLTLRAEDDDPVVIAGVGIGDTDGDALPDLWEVVGVDSNGDGHIDINLPAMGADPHHKDIFVEIDFMVMPPSTPGGSDGHSHEPSPGAIRTIVEAFGNAPVSNPDGATGIHLHVDYGPTAPLTYGSRATWGNLSRGNALGHQEFISTCDDQGDFQWVGFNVIAETNFVSTRERIFHYNIWAHSQCTAAPNTSGIARIGGTDLIVSLGGDVWDGNTGTASQQAGTFMHELGHNLGLDHGGNEDRPNFKPNYLSVMNYSFQTSGLAVSNPNRRFDYSRLGPDDISDLDESDLDETAGLGLPATASYITHTRVRCPNRADPDGDPLRLWREVGTTIWNCDFDATDTNIHYDVTQEGNETNLSTFDDWAFIGREGILSGGQIGLGTSLVGPPAETPLEEYNPYYSDELPVPTNQPPIATVDEFRSTPAPSLVLDVLANDSDLDGDILSITTVSTSTNGTVTTDGTQIIYMPNQGFIGTDIFSYTISDGNGGTATATVVITITATEEPLLQLSVAALNYNTVVDGGSPRDQVVNISNRGTGTLNWTAGESIPWLTLSATAGVAPSIVMVTIDSSGLAVGDYIGEIHINAGVRPKRLW